MLPRSASQPQPSLLSRELLSFLRHHTLAAPVIFFSCLESSSHGYLPPSLLFLLPLLHGRRIDFLRTADVLSVFTESSQLGSSGWVVCFPLQADKRCMGGFHARLQRD